MDKPSSLRRIDRAINAVTRLRQQCLDHERAHAAAVAAGMNIVRVNCAHDDARAWSGMVANVRNAE